MKLTESWLKEWIAFTQPITEILNVLTNRGLELESEETQQNDCVIELSVTPNRADCLSVMGVAREVALIVDKPFVTKVIKPVTSTSKRQVNVAIEAEHACPAYATRVIEQVNPKAQTPQWIADRLEQTGQRLIDPIVDILNYVMLDLGQPMHAFDLKKLNEATLVVRFSKPGETIELLDGSTKTCTTNTLLIADRTGPQALAGIMGSAHSQVTEQTTDILLESAFFDPNAIAGIARGYNLTSEASFRFERGVDPLGHARAIEYATALILEYCGGKAGPISVQSSNKATEKVVPLHIDRVHQLLGVQVGKDFIKDVLTRLGGTCTPTKTGFNVLAPSFRFDWQIEEDLIEEVGRLYGLDNIKPLPLLAVNPIIHSEKKWSIDGLKVLLHARAYQEIITYSFVDPKWQESLNPGVPMAPILNPISSDKSVMRTNLWVGLLQTIESNQRRQIPSMRLYETGLKFLPHGTGWTQTPCIAGAITGYRAKENWADEKVQVDFFDIKGDVEALLSHIQPSRLSFKRAKHSALHPGQTAHILLDNQVIGLIGALHPGLKDSLGLDYDVYVFELESEKLLQRDVPKAQAPSKYPSIRRDIALLLPNKEPIGDVMNTIRSVGADLLTDLCLFDVYEGKGVPEGQKSIAIGLTLQSLSRTLIDKDIDDLMSILLRQLSTEHQANLRE